MAQHYSIKDFFRQMPNALLARYFKTKGLFSDLDFVAMKEGKPDELFVAWLALPDKQRNAMDAEFREIFEMSCEKGFRAVIDEAEFQLDEEEFTAFVEKLSALPSQTTVGAMLAGSMTSKACPSVAILSANACSVIRVRARASWPRGRGADWW